MSNLVSLKQNKEGKYIVQGANRDLFVLDLADSSTDVVLEVLDETD